MKQDHNNSAFAYSVGACIGFRVRKIKPMFFIAYTAKTGTVTHAVPVFTIKYEDFLQQRENSYKFWGKVN